MIVDQLTRLSTYRDFERAFRNLTGMALRLRPIDAFERRPRGRPCQNPFCALPASGHPLPGGCLQREPQVARVAGLPLRTVECFAGLTDVLVPVRLGAQWIGVLHAGQMLERRPDRRRLARALASLQPEGRAVGRERLAQAYFRAPVLAGPGGEVVLRLLVAFARRLANLSSRCVVPETRPDPPAVARAKAFIAEHQGEDLTLSTVAQAVGMSAFYFCKLFKQATGFTYTDYLAHVRIETVKQLLLERGRRISDSAFASGFQSLSQFNRVFRRVTGEPPTVYRNRLLRSAAGGGGFMP